MAEELGDKVRIVKVDTDAEPTLASQLQVYTHLASDTYTSQACPDLTRRTHQPGRTAHNTDSL